MNHLELHNQCTESVTLVSNRFLDAYMPKANGEFVKIYLYLLRIMNDPNSELTLSSIADTFDCTENDVERALRYWDKKHVIQLTVNHQNTITGLTVLPLAPEPDCGKTQAQPASEISSPSQTAQNDSASFTLTADKVKELKQNEEIVQLLFIAEQYLGKTLSPTETSRILYFYEHLHFSVDLIEYLIEYCVSKGSKSIRYMEKVALSWAESGISSVDMAKQETNTYHKNYFTVLKAFGISGRTPVDSEIKFINRWLNEFGFTMDIITEACSRTVSQTGKASFQYTDGILNAWYKNGVRSLSDVRTQDQRYRENRDKREKSSSKPIAKATNKFNNFHQRDYNFSDLERQLLKK